MTQKSETSSTANAGGVDPEVQPLVNLLTRQRWFGGKARTIASASVRATIPIDGKFTIALLSVTYTDDGEETYFMPVVDTPVGLSDALADTNFARQLYSLIECAETIASPQGVIGGERSALFESFGGRPDELEPIRAAAHDQSNSAVAFGERLFLKIFRKVEPGLNPDYELAKYLTEQTTFRRLPRIAGAIQFKPKVGPTMTLATLQELIRNEGSAWGAMLRNVAASLELASVQPAAGAELLGQRTAELHRALASATQDPALTPEPLTIDDCEALAARLRRTATSVFEMLRQASATLEATTATQTKDLLERGPALVDKFHTLLADDPCCVKTRIHGDYHLGQVLCQNGDFIILDFEGEPARSLAERRAKDSPLRDVAGMLRSFSYVAYAGLFEFTAQNPGEFSRLEPVANAWVRETSETYLRGYLTTARGADFLPAKEQHLATLLDFFLVEKALYEVLYELNNRPAWLRIPLAGILAIA